MPLPTSCCGMVNYLDGVALAAGICMVARAVSAKTGVALITQSSNILINMSMQQRGLPLAYLIAAGNGAQVGLPQLIAAMDADPTLTAHRFCILRGLAMPPPFMLPQSPAHQAHRPQGGGDGMQALTVSHLLHFPSSDAMADAYARRCGAGRVKSLEGLLGG